MQITLDKIASAAGRVGLDQIVEIGTEISAERGAVLAVEALEEKSVYGELEIAGGDLVHIRPGDRLAGVLGERQALKGFVGALPAHVAVGDTLHVLNMGGVLGVCRSANPDYGQPLRVRVLGAVLVDGRPANIAQFALPWQTSLPASAPLILVSGTCMNAGKTTVACALIAGLTARGYRVAAAKLAGVATQRDVLNMHDHGAVAALSFSDAGLPSTTRTDACLVPAAKGILAALNQAAPDVIVVEFGDGIMGHYGVDILLRDREIIGHTRAHLLCANDLVAAWGGLRFLETLGLAIDCISGPATDNSAGVDYIQERFGVPAANGRSEADRLVDLVAERVFGAPVALALDLASYAAAV